jgi:hypothetical protein
MPQDYNEAVQDPASCFFDSELAAGIAATDAFGIPRPRSGNFADVYQICCPSGDWAAKCFTREVRGLHQRYAAVSDHMDQANLPFAVEFHHLDKGVRVGDRWFPLVKMRWVEGATLNEFVRDQLDNPALLGALLQIWVRMGRRLREARIAHGDLQHGNVLLVPGSTEQSLALKLIDYDGMWVPALAQMKSGEVGHPNYQHRQRLREGTYGPELDRFPLLVVATALRCLQVGGPSLWKKYDNGDNLLFKESDFATPHQSSLFADLLTLPAGEARSAAYCLMAAAQQPIEKTPLLEEVFTQGAGPARSPPSFPALPDSMDEPGVPTTSSVIAPISISGEQRKRRGRRIVFAFVASGVLLAAALISGLAIRMLNHSSTSPPHTDGENQVVAARTALTTPSGPRIAPETSKSAPVIDPGEMQKRVVLAAKGPVSVIAGGKEAELEVRVERNGSSKGIVQIKIIGLPNGVMADEGSIPDTDDRVVLPIRATADAAAGDYKITLRAWVGDDPVDAQVLELHVARPVLDPPAIVARNDQPQPVTIRTTDGVSLRGPSSPGRSARKGPRYCSSPSPGGATMPPRSPRWPGPCTPTGTRSC